MTFASVKPSAPGNSGAFSNTAKLLTCTALSTALLMSFSGALAQDVEVIPPSDEAAQADDGDDAKDIVVVTGFRGSIRSAQQVKRASDVIADVVSAEDIGRLPDVSIAESLARLPGVTSQRTGGQASALNIRGFSQELISATLNGREQVGSNGDRTIEFDQYPSELVYQAQVFKSPKASQIEGGVAGKIELQTVSPLDTGRTVFNINLRGSYNDRASQVTDASDLGYRLSASYQTQLADNTIGIAVGYARLKQANVATRFVGFDFQGGATFGDGFDPDGDEGPSGFLPAINAGAPVLDLNSDGQPDAVPFGFESIQFGGDEKRDSILGVVEWRPSDNFNVQVDTFYSNFDTEGFRRGARLVGTQNIQNQGFIVNPDDPTTSIGVATGLPFFSDAVVSNNAIVGANFISGNGLDVENVNQDDGDTDEIFNIGGKARWDVSESFAVTADVSYSTSTAFFANAGITTQAGFFDDDGSFVDLPLEVGFFRNGLDIATQSFNFDFSDPATNPAQGFFFVPRTDEDELFAVALDFEYALEAGPFSSFEFGARYTDRQAVRTVESFSGPAGDFVNAFGLDSPTLIPSEFIQTNGFTGKFAEAGSPNFTVIDIFPALENFLGIDELVPDQNFGFTLDQSFTNNENTIAGYVQGNLETTLFGLPLRGNLGLRVVNTEQSSTTFSSPDEAGISFTQFLPSANLIFDLSDNQLLRLAGGRQISRPSFLDLGAGVTAQADTGGFVTGGGGNPALLPFVSNQGEISYEHYFGDASLFSVGFFYKSLQSFIFGGADPAFDFAAAGIPIPPQPPGSQPITSFVGLFTGPVNGEGGNAFGVEVGFTTQFTSLPAPFDGLGVVLNYSYSDSSIQLPDSTLSGNAVSIPLEGLSSHVANPTIFYELGGFETRVGVRYRSGFVANQFGLSEQITGFEGETVVDWQASYSFPDESRLSGLRLLLQANNLTDSGTDSFFGFPAQTGTIQRFGRQFFFGASFTY